MPVTSPNPHAAGSTQFSRWWVVNISGHGLNTLTAIMRTSKPTNSATSQYVAGPFTSQKAADAFISNKQGSGFPSIPLPNVGGWLSSLGADVGSGIESGFVNFFKDLWNVIIGPMEVLLGVLIALWVLVIYFKDDLMKLGSAIGPMMMAI